MKSDLDRNKITSLADRLPSFRYYFIAEQIIKDKNDSEEDKLNLNELFVERDMKNRKTRQRPTSGFA
jgi:hypothetical protein